MPAKVYQLAVAGQDDDFPLLHVVVIDIDASQRLCIPAYDAAGQSVNKLTTALHRTGIFEGTGWVEIDNSVAVTFRGQWTGKLAKWVPYKLSRVEQRHLRSPMGEMSDQAFSLIVECLLKLHAAQPGSTLGEDELKKVKRLAGTLGVAVPIGI